MDPASAMGYHAAQSTVVAYDYHNDVFFLANGARVPSDAPLQPPECRAAHMPALGKYATCWLGDCTILSLTGRRAIVHTTCGEYAVAPHLLRPLRHTVTVRGLRVLYGSDRCLVFPSLTCTGGATALLEQVVETMRRMGLRVARDRQLLEQQAVVGPSTALRVLNVHAHMLLQLRGDVEGVARAEPSCHEVSASVALAHFTIEEYLSGNPWALPISHELLCKRLGVAAPLVPGLLFGPYTSYGGSLFLEAPQRPLSQPVFEVEADDLVLAVRAGRVEPQRDGTYVMPYASGGYGAVTARGVSLSSLMWELDDLYEELLPLGVHRVDLPGCPAALLSERFGGEAYDHETGTITSSL